MWFDLHCIMLSFLIRVLFVMIMNPDRADSRFAPSQSETALLCNGVSHWLSASLESALPWYILRIDQVVPFLVCSIRTFDKMGNFTVKWLCENIVYIQCLKTLCPAFKTWWLIYSKQSRARRLFFPELGSRTTIKQYGLVRNLNLLGHNDNDIFFGICNGKNNKLVRTLIICMFTFYYTIAVFEARFHIINHLCSCLEVVLFIPVNFWCHGEQDYISMYDKCMEITRQIWGIW